jgi:hypothetical protein
LPWIGFGDTLRKMSDPEDHDEGHHRRMCQTCFRAKAEHQCQSCRRVVCDGCVAPTEEVRREDAVDEADFLESFLQAAQIRCKGCRDDDVPLGSTDLQVERG